MPLKQTNLCEFCNFLNWSFNFVDGSHWHYAKLFLKWFGMAKFSIKWTVFQRVYLGMDTNLLFYLFIFILFTLKKPRD